MLQQLQIGNFVKEGGCKERRKIEEVGRSDGYFGLFSRRGSAKKAGNVTELVDSSLRGTAFWPFYLECSWTLS